MIYFVQPVDGGPIKIGTTENINVRLRALEHHYGCPLSVLATMEGGKEKEAELHDRFAHLRFDKTEQFRPARDLLAFIGRPLLVSPNPEAVEVLGVVGNSKPMIVQIRGTQEYKDWAESIADKEGFPLAMLFDRAMRKYARDMGYPEPPRR